MYISDRREWEDTPTNRARVAQNIERVFPGVEATCTKVHYDQKAETIEMDISVKPTQGVKYINIMNTVRVYEPKRIGGSPED